MRKGDAAALLGLVVRQGAVGHVNAAGDEEHTSSADGLAVGGRLVAFCSIAADHRVVDREGFPIAVENHAAAITIRGVAIDHAVRNRPVRDIPDVYAATGIAGRVLE